MAEGLEAIDSTNQIARNEEFSLSTLHTRGQSPKAITLQNAYMAILFDQGDGLSKEVWVGQEWKSKLWSRGHQFCPLKIPSLTRSWPLDWRGYFEQWIEWDARLGLDFGLGLWRLHTMTVQVKRPWKFMAKGLDFGLGLWRLHTMPNWRLQFPYFIGLCIFSPFLCTLNKVWPLNSTV